MAGPAHTYADLADLADGAPLIVRVQPRKIVQVEAERARGVKPGWGRFYIEANTQALIAGSGSLGPQQRYLVDLPLDAKGKPPKLKKTSVMIFARSVPGRPGELQLVAPDAQIAWSAELDSRVRAIMTELYAAGAPQRVTAVREAMYMPGTLAGDGMTQLFLGTANGEPAALTVTHRPGEPPRWGVSYSELAVSDDAPPARDTLAWYRLACFLPRNLPRNALQTGTADERAMAVQDYRYILSQLGPCTRNRN